MSRSKENYKKWYSENKDRLKKKYEDNKEEILKKAKDRYDPLKKSEYNKKYMLEHKEEKREYDKKYYLENKEEIIDQHREYVSENKESVSTYLKEYNSDPENIIKRRIRVKEKYDNDEFFKFSLLFRNNLSLLLKKNGLLKNKTTEEILGCSIEEFRIYLESKFEDWMNWENRGLYNGEYNFGWDIDHITPLSSAIIKEDILILNHYTNLQPLCSFTNRHLKKGEILHKNCLYCAKEVINRLYCDERCKRKYYYHNKEGVSESKIENVKKNRNKSIKK